jgi:hypothetical protein
LKTVERKFDISFLENSTAVLECLSHTKQDQRVAGGEYSEVKGVQTLEWYLTNNISVTGLKKWNSLYWRKIEQVLAFSLSPHAKAIELVPLSPHTYVVDLCYRAQKLSLRRQCNNVPKDFCIFLVRSCRIQ